MYMRSMRGKFFEGGGGEEGGVLGGGVSRGRLCVLIGVRNLYWGRTKDWAAY